MLEFKPKVKKCEKCGALYASRLKDCPMCTFYYFVPGNKKIVNTFEKELKQKYGKKFKNGRFGENNPNYGNYKLKNNELEIINLHFLGLNCIQIAKKFNCYPGTVRELLKRNNIELSTGLKLNKNPNWKNGKLISRGYVYSKMPKHPNANKAGYIAEHRLVIEESLGRYLDENEVVHHKDGNRRNNIIENLEVLDTNSEHFKKFHQLKRDELGRFKKIYV